MVLFKSSSHVPWTKNGSINFLAFHRVFCSASKASPDFQIEVEFHGRGTFLFVLSVALFLVIFLLEKDEE